MNFIITNDGKAVAITFNRHPATANMRAWQYINV